MAYTQRVLSLTAAVLGLILFFVFLVLLLQAQKKSKTHDYPMWYIFMVFLGMTLFIVGILWMIPSFKGGS